MPSSTLDNTLGALTIGFAVSCLLYGVTIMQVYIYSERYPFDKRPYKALVAVVMFLETVEQALLCHVVYTYQVTGWGQLRTLLKPTWSLIMQVLFGGLIAILVKSCFTLRVYRFTKSYLLTASLILLNLVELGFVIVYIVEAFRLNTFHELEKLTWLTNVALALDVVVDVVISSTLCICLFKIRGNSTRSRSMVNNLIFYAAGTGLLPSACAIGALISFDTLPQAFVFIALYFVLVKLYSNSLLATLNTRMSVRGQGRYEDDTMTGSHHQTHSTSGIPLANVNGVKVTVTTQSDVPGIGVSSYVEKVHTGYPIGRQLDCEHADRFTEFPTMTYLAR